eukprot:COSAG06_NODE_149_length_22026_cov_33.454782_8_plen_40_part_00
MHHVVCKRPLNYLKVVLSRRVAMGRLRRVYTKLLFEWLT